MRNMVFGALIALSGSALLYGRQTASAEPTIRVIQPQRILAEATDARAELERFQATQQQKNVELRGKQQALDATRRELAAATTATDRQRLQEQEIQQRGDFERSTAQAQSELQGLQRQMQAALQARIRTALQEILKGQNVQMVLNAETSVVWASSSADLTSAVIERLNTGKAGSK
jgi:Skp family chaperone for outer membrane proteins